MRKVKNLRGSTAAKIIAWIALSASALCFVFSAMGVIFMFDEGIYRNSKDETRKQWFENVSYEYGLSAVDDVRREQPAGSVESKYFKYGIIKADSLDGIDLNNENHMRNATFRIRSVWKTCIQTVWNYRTKIRLYTQMEIF